MALLLFAARRAIGNAVRLLECAGEAVSDMIQLFLAPIIFGTRKQSLHPAGTLLSYACGVISLNSQPAVSLFFSLKSPFPSSLVGSIGSPGRFISTGVYSEFTSVSPLLFSAFSLQSVALVLDRGVHVHRLGRDCRHHRGEKPRQGEGACLLWGVTSF